MYTLYDTFFLTSPLDLRAMRTFSSGMSVGTATRAATSEESDEFSVSLRGGLWVRWGATEAKYSLA